MLGHPGKKLLFMGQDFGQWHEWDEKVSLDWYLTDEDSHRRLRNMCGICSIFIKNIPPSSAWTTNGMASSGSMPMMGTAAFSVLSEGMRPGRRIFSSSSISRRWSARITGWACPDAEISSDPRSGPRRLCRRTDAFLHSQKGGMRRSSLFLRLSPGALRNRYFPF